MKTNNYISTKTPWWYNYRQQRYKKRNYLTMEMIIRRSFVQTLKEYLNATSLGGIKQIRESNNSRVQRFMWIAIFCFALVAVCIYYHATWMTIFTRPLLVTVDSYNYPIKEIDFPAVSLCNFNRISKKALVEYSMEISKSLKLNARATRTAYEYLRHFDRLIDYRYDDHLQRIINASPLNESLTNVTHIMYKLAPRCADMLVKCKWGSKVVNCSEIFLSRRTGLGYCCTFNYVFDLADPTERLVKRQVVPGRENGLLVVADPMPEDSVDQRRQRNGFQVLIHDPRHFPEFRGGRVQYRILQANQVEIMQIESIKQYSTAEVHKYSSKTRQCLFHNEFKETYNNLYSYSGCLVKCRIEVIQSLCKCIPFFYPGEKYKNSKTCTLSHMKCVDKYNVSVVTQLSGFAMKKLIAESGPRKCNYRLTEKLLYLYPTGSSNTAGLEAELADSVYCPNCLPDCELTYTYARQFKLSEMSHKNVLGGVNFTNMCVLNIYRPTNVGTLHRLDAVAYWFDTLCSIGGFSGMIMGLGSFTYSEIVYYAIIRFPRTVYINYKKYH